MSSLFGDPPTPPDPNATARAQTSTNVSTAVANAFLNNTNQTSPDGSLDYNQTGSYSWTDPTTNATYNIPRFTATQTLSPEQQQIKAQTDAQIQHGRDGERAVGPHLRNTLQRTRSFRRAVGG